MLDGSDAMFDEPILDRMDTLRGDIRDAILDVVKGLKKPWGKTNELDQVQIISNADRVARQLVGDAVRIVASRGEGRYLEGRLDQFTVKDAIKASVTFSAHSLGRDYAGTLFESAAE